MHVCMGGMGKSAVGATGTLNPPFVFTRVCVGGMGKSAVGATGLSPVRKMGFKGYEEYAPSILPFFPKTGGGWMGAGLGIEAAFRYDIGIAGAGNWV